MNNAFQNKNSFQARESKHFPLEMPGRRITTLKFCLVRWEACEEQPLSPRTGDSFPQPGHWQLSAGTWLEGLPRAAAAQPRAMHQQKISVKNPLSF